MSILEVSERTSSGISLKLYNVTMTHAMNMNVTSVNTALTCPPSMTPIDTGVEKSGGKKEIVYTIVYRFDSTSKYGRVFFSFHIAREHWAGFIQ
jgi:hypothetical protein